MFYLLFLIFAALGFGVQLVLCFRVKTNWLRWLPAVCLLVLDAVCWAVYLLELFPDRYGAAFAAGIYGFLLLWLLGAVLLAWGIWAIVKVSQKRRK